MKRNVKAGDCIRMGDKTFVVCYVVQSNEAFPNGRCRLIDFKSPGSRGEWHDTLVFPDAKLARDCKPVCVVISQLSSEWPETLSAARKAATVTRGIEFWPYDTYGWGEGGYHVEPDGTLKAIGADWDSSG